MWPWSEAGRAGDRRQEHQVPTTPVQHRRQDVSGKDHGRLEVEAGRGPDDRRIDDGRHVSGLHASVVDQHVDRPVVGFDPGHEGLDGRRVGQVNSHRSTTHLSGDGLQFVRCPRGHHDVGTRTRIGPGQ